MKTVIIILMVMLMNVVNAEDRFTYASQLRNFYLENYQDVKFRVEDNTLVVSYFAMGDVFVYHFLKNVDQRFIDAGFTKLVFIDTYGKKELHYATYFISGQPSTSDDEKEIAVKKLLSNLYGAKIKVKNNILSISYAGINEESLWTFTNKFDVRLKSIGIKKIFFYTDLDRGTKITSVLLGNMCGKN